MGTLSMVANMMGLGPVLAAVNDPAAHEHVRQIIAAILATNQRCERLEHKIDLLCRAWGIEEQQAVAEYVGRFEPAPLPPRDGADGGTAGPEPASGTPDNGTGTPAASFGLAAALESYAAAVGADFDLEAWLAKQVKPDG